VIDAAVTFFFDKGSDAFKVIAFIEDQNECNLARIVCQKSVLHLLLPDRGERLKAAFCSVFGIENVHIHGMS